jgi:diaminopimelate epimerase
MSQTLAFTKMHGAGNDFVVLDGIRDELPELAPIAARLADRNFGIGCDQILVVRPSKEADFRMEIYNADGSQVEMCANGIRAFYHYLRRHGHTTSDEISVETLGGIVYPRAEDEAQGEGRVTVNMGLPVLTPAKIPTQLGSGEGPVLDAALEVGGQTLLVSSVSMGNPHAVIFVEGNVDDYPVEEIGPLVENHPAFPNRVNVEFVEVLSPTRVRQRTWERGTGETLACGSGACAVTVASILRGATERSISIELRGGELQINWLSENANVLMTGPATEVFSGQITL